jgi:hypothetical protein
MGARRADSNRRAAPGEYATGPVATVAESRATGAQPTLCLDDECIGGLSHRPKVFRDIRCKVVCLRRSVAGAHSAPLQSLSVSRAVVRTRDA